MSSEKLPLNQFRKRYCQGFTRSQLSEAYREYNSNETLPLLKHVVDPLDVKAVEEAKTIEEVKHEELCCCGIKECPGEKVASIQMKQQDDSYDYYTSEEIE